MVVNFAPELVSDQDMPGSQKGVNWLVTGGAGYIGAHVVRALQGEGSRVGVIDDLSTGNADRLPGNVLFFHGDVRDTSFMSDVATALPWNGVVHLAAVKEARQSMLHPKEYWTRNVGASLALLHFLSENSVSNIVLSSSCSIFGDASEVGDETVLEPISPYGRTKLVTEQMFFDSASELNLNVVALRYFNVIGNGSFKASEDSAHDALVPSIFRSLAQGFAPVVYGCDYATQDGTCVRDYVDVRDLAHAHVLAAKYVNTSHPPTETSINLASATPTSVLEIVKAATAITGSDLDPVFEARKGGDPAAVWGDNSSATKLLGWRPKLSLYESLRSHWAQVGQFNADSSREKT